MLFFERKYLFAIVIFFTFANKAYSKSEIISSIGNHCRVQKTISSWVSLRDKNVVKQKFDYSCGSGALATLINMISSENLSEDDVIDSIMNDKSPEELDFIFKNGYSFLDLKKAAEDKGFDSSVFRLNMKHLYSIKQPVIVYYLPDDKRHFAVLKCITTKKVCLSDPARGNIKIPIYTFRKEWSGFVMTVDARQ